MSHWTDEEKLKRVILTGAEVIRQGVKEWADPVALLGAIAEVESGFGRHSRPRPEPAYMPKGKYWSTEQRQRWDEWGGLVGMSYGSFQIMYPTAVEMGFDAHRNPLDLQDDEVGVHFVLKFISLRIIEKGVAQQRYPLASFADAYNSGNFMDERTPVEYMEDFIRVYKKVVETRNLKREVANV